MKKEKLRIAVNTRLLLSNKLEGIGWFTYEIFRRLVKNHPQVEWYFIFDRPFAPHFIFAENVKGIVMGPPARHPILWEIWFEWRLPAKLKKIQADIFVSTDGYVSLKSAVPDIAVIHDINFEHHPENIAKKARSYFLRNFKKFARKATRIATVSEYSRNDISETYHIDKNKIDLVYNGCGDFFKPLNEADQQKLRNEISEGSQFFIFIGALNPRKNLEGMLAAYNVYRTNGGKDKFVIVGEKMFWNKSLSEIYQKHPYKKDIIFTGRQEGEGLSKILASSRALLFVSHFEGFGIPIVEAFKCEVPVITSNTTSMPEVAGDAALICNPKDINSIAKAMQKVENSEIRRELIQKGKVRSTMFTWDRSAEMMWESIEKVLEEKKINRI